MKSALAAASQATVVLAVVLSYPPRAAAQSDPWDRVRLIEVGKNVQVKLLSGKTVKGKMKSWSPEGMQLRKGEDNVVPVAKADVQRVSYVAGMSRGNRAGWAFLIGGGAGAALGAAACRPSSDCEIHPAAAAGVIALWVGGISAGIAALIPQHKETVYLAVPAGSEPPAGKKPGGPAND